MVWNRSLGQFWLAAFYRTDAGEWEASNHPVFKLNEMSAQARHSVDDPRIEAQGCLEIKVSIARQQGAAHTVGDALCALRTILSLLLGCTDEKFRESGELRNHLKCGAQQKGLLLPMPQSGLRMRAWIILSF
jgi:predicted phage gp36 major capsid-like protein